MSGKESHLAENRPPVYCQKCSRPLIASQRDEGDGPWFDAFTGQIHTPDLVPQLECPRALRADEVGDVDYGYQHDRWRLVGHAWLLRI